MTKKSPAFLLSLTAFVLYIAGGFAAFGGIAMVTLMGGHDLFGWGDAGAIGYLFICVGLCLSILGVLFLRLVRNRTDQLIGKYAKRFDNGGSN